MAVQGRAFNEDQIGRIIHLLSKTDMTISEIAERMRCSRSAVVRINGKFKLRAYNGRKASWGRSMPAALSADDTIDESKPAA